MQIVEEKSFAIHFKNISRRLRWRVNRCKRNFSQEAGLLNHKSNPRLFEHETEDVTIHEHSVPGKDSSDYGFSKNSAKSLWGTELWKWNVVMTELTDCHNCVWILMCSACSVFVLLPVEIGYHLGTNVSRKSAHVTVSGWLPIQLHMNVICCCFQAWQLTICDMISTLFLFISLQFYAQDNMRVLYALWMTTNSYVDWFCCYR
jgi:hypothetical protein